MYLTFTGDQDRVEKIFSKFYKDFKELSERFNGIQDIPEGEEVILKSQANMEKLTLEAVKTETKAPAIRRQKTIKRKKVGNKEEFSEADLAIFEERANRME